MRLMGIHGYVGAAILFASMAGSCASPERVDQLEPKSKITATSMQTVSEADAQKPTDVDKKYIDDIKKIAEGPFDQVVARLNTPTDAAIYCTKVLTHGGDGYDNKTFGGEYWASGRVTHQSKLGDCDDGAVAAASLLADDGYPPYVLVMNGLNSKGESACHAVFVYQNEHGFGSIGINESDIQPPPCDTLDALLGKISRDSGITYYKYTLYDLRPEHPDFATNNINNSVMH
jgi:hypothetical protein